jgi:hypothetical protein
MSELSSAAWLKRLNVRLDGRQSVLSLYEDYYYGDHRLAFATTKFRQTFGQLFDALAINFCLLVVDAERERLKIDGFRMGGTDDSASDDEAWRIWQANRLDAKASIAHTEALVKGVSYALVWGNPLRPDTPLIRIQDPRRVVVEYDDGDLDTRLAALKRWVDRDGFELATLWLPDRMEKYRSRGTIKGGAITRGEGYWQQRTVEGEPWPLPNPLGVVPIVPFVNNPTLASEGRSELQTVVPIQDAINKLVADMIVAAEYAAFPQRWATGIEIPRDEHDKPIEQFRAGVDRFWGTEALEAKFGQFPSASLEPYVKGIEMLTQQAASITRTPPHYLLGLTGQFPSGESLAATEAGLVAKVESQQRHFGEAWEEVMGLAFRVVGRTVDTDAAEVRWAPAERRAPAQYADALGKQRTMLGIPQLTTWEKAGYSQTEVQRMMGQLEQERIAANVTDVMTPDQAQTVARLIQAGFEPAAALQALRLPPIRHTGLTPVTVREEPA